MVTDGGKMALAKSHGNYISIRKFILTSRQQITAVVVVFRNLFIFMSERQTLP